MRQFIKISAMSLSLLIFLTFANIFAQAMDSTSHHHMMGKDNKHMVNHMKDSTNMMMMDSTSQMKMDSHNMQKMKNDNMDKMKHNPMVHENVIDLMKIDENKDGKVYQDMMDWNVISDKPGDCPVCGMKLKEVTLDQAKQNLKEHNFKTK